MARILYSGVVSELRGSVKGTTFQRNCAGSIAKGKNNSRFSASNMQSAEQLDFAKFACAWNLLPFGYKDEWNVFASDYQRTDFWGNVKTISGFQWFMSIMRNASLLGQTAPDQAPANANVASVPSCVINTNGTIVYIDFGGIVNLTGKYIVAFATGPRRVAATSSRQPTLFMKYATGAAVETIDLTSAWNTAYHILWADYYDLDSAGLICYVYAINLANYVSSAYTKLSWSKL